MNTTNPNYIIEVADIQKKYGSKQVLSGVSFVAAPGECIGIVGANGCGKSTLLGILSGSLKKDSGTIHYNGKSPCQHKQLFSQLIGYVPQDNPLMDNLSVRDNLRFWYCESSRSLEEDFQNGVPACFGLTSYQHYDVSKLSGGLKKRLSIACSLAKDPPILILDEPGASLDIVCKEDIKNYLASYLADGGTVLIASHEEYELELCDRIYLLQNGGLTAIPELDKASRRNTSIGSFLRGRIVASEGR